MKTKTKIALDRILGVLIAYPLNVLVRLVGKLTRFDHSLKSEMNTIVVCKFKGMGSIIQATPLLQTLRNRYPNAKLIFVSSIENKAILEKIHLIDESLIVDDRKLFTFFLSTLRLIQQLIKRKADLYIDLEIYSNFSSIITTLSMSRDRFGYYLRSNSYRMGLYTHMMYFNTKAPIAEAYLQFARLLNISEIETELYQIELPSENESQTPYLVINPNASDLRYERRWPAHLFIELIYELRKSHPKHEIVLIGSKNEAEYVSKISTVFQEDPFVIDQSGKTNLTELIQVLEKAELVITNDTGPMHLASSLKTSVIALFGPCSPQQYGLGSNVKAIYKNVYCSPCVHEFVSPPCKGDNQCMKLITVTEVMQAILENSTDGLAHSISYTSQQKEALGKVFR